jgi:hypothetical protein
MGDLMSVSNNFVSKEYWNSAINAIVDRLNNDKLQEAVQIFERTALSPTTPQIAPEIINEISTRLYANRLSVLKVREICEYVQRALPSFLLTVLVEESRQTQPNQQNSWIVEPQQPQQKPDDIQAFFDPEALPKPKAVHPVQSTTPTQYQGRPTARKIQDIRQNHEDGRAQKILDKMLLQGRSGTYESEAAFRPIRGNEVPLEFMSEEEQIAHAIRLSEQEVDNSLPA